MANIKITDLQGLIIEELDEETSVAVVGGLNTSVSINYDYAILQLASAITPGTNAQIAILTDD